MLGFCRSSMVAGPAGLLHWIRLPIQAQMVFHILVGDVPRIIYCYVEEGDLHNSDADSCPMPAVTFEFLQYNAVSLLDCHHDSEDSEGK